MSWSLEVSHPIECSARNVPMPSPEEPLRSRRSVAPSDEEVVHVCRASKLPLVQATSGMVSLRERSVTTLDTRRRSLPERRQLHGRAREQTEQGACEFDAERFGGLSKQPLARLPKGSTRTGRRGVPSALLQERGRNQVIVAAREWNRAVLANRA